MHINYYKLTCRCSDANSSVVCHASAHVFNASAHEHVLETYQSFISCMSCNLRRRRRRLRRRLMTKLQFALSTPDSVLVTLGDKRPLHKGPENVEVWRLSILCVYLFTYYERPFASDDGGNGQVCIHSSLKVCTLVYGDECMLLVP